LSVRGNPTRNVPDRYPNGTTVVVGGTCNGERRNFHTRNISTTKHELEAAELIPYTSPITVSPSSSIFDVATPEEAERGIPAPAITELT
jgi:hypothetical protein